MSRATTGKAGSTVSDRWVNEQPKRNAGGHVRKAIHPPEAVNPRAAETMESNVVAANLSIDHTAAMAYLSENSTFAPVLGD
jgi:hypothetical protein